MEKAIDILLNNGLAGVVILGLAYALWRFVNPVLKAYTDTIKKVGETNEKLVPMLDKITERLALIPATSEDLEKAKQEIIQEIKRS